MAKARTKAFKLALVGGETLLGRELQEVLADRAIGAVIAQYAASGEGIFSEQEGEAVYLEPLDGKSIREDRAILIAGSRDGALKAYEIAKKAGRPTLIDCTGYLENQPEARIVAPLLEEPGPHPSWLSVIAHPAASALALVLRRLARYLPIRQSIANIFEPASERGKRGISELHQQTAGLLSFKPLDKDVFDAQLSFNLLSQYGEEAALRLSTIEERIQRDLALLLNSDGGNASIPVPSLRLIQAPVFHGYSISAWIEFDGNVRVQELGEALASAQIEIRGSGDVAPDNAGTAGQSGLIAGDIRIDRNNERAAWLWVVGDNLRLIADAAVELVSEMARDQE